MEAWLPAHGVAYRWEAELGGLRRPRSDSRNTGLRHPAFRGYADYMETDEFGAALTTLVTEAGDAPTVVMCSESVWWRCHRRLLADAAFLLAHLEVVHLMHGGSVRNHLVTDCAVVDGARLAYPPIIGG